ncbi:Solute carrier family 13 member 3 [Hypsibius exemplaris]|uniref:Solute carrier family 13 member 3 n=1 Tax=Hypsibius exemplaris TaxID=2072580 RepID=A0A1W0XDT6_HYPEX|nr:Solute carrier family 13 member 3 [Hypsibius exemplaris]
MAGRNCCSALLAQWRLFAFMLVPVACMPLPISWNTDSGKAAYVILVTSIFMVLDIIPLSATVLFAIFLIPMTGVQTIQETSKHFVTDSYLFLLGVVMLAVAIEEVNLHKRMSLFTLRVIGASPSRLIFGFIHISGFLSMWMPNTAVTLMILPIAIAISETLEIPDQNGRRLSAAPRHPLSDTIQMRRTGKKEIAIGIPSPYFEDDGTALIDKGYRPSKNTNFGNGDIDPKVLSKALQLAVAFAANIGGMATLIGSHPNIIFRLTVEKIYGMDTGLNFLSYFLICAPVALAALFTTWIIFSAIYVPRWCRCSRNRSSPLVKSLTEQRKMFLDEQYRELGPVSPAEISVVVTFIVVIGLWLTRHPQIFPGWATLLPPNFATDSLPTFFAVVLLFVWPADFQEFARGIYRPLLVWKRVQAKLPWDLLIFNGGVTVLSQLAQDSGLITVMGTLIPNLQALSPWHVAIIISIISSVLTEFTNNSIVTAMFIPILANYAEDTGVNPLYYMLACTMSSMFSFMVPISSFPTLIVYGYGTVTRRDMLKAGLGPKIVCILMLVVSLEFLGELVLPGWKTFPVWANEHLRSRLMNGESPVTGIFNLTTTNFPK